jgi:hypothetical protein
VRLVVVRGTQNAVIDGVLAQKFELFKKPSALHSTVAGSESHVSPAAGTA